MFLSSKLLLFSNTIYCILIYSSSAGGRVAADGASRQLRQKEEPSKNLPTNTNECCDIGEYPMCFIGIARCCSQSREWVCPNGDTDEYNCPEEDGINQGCSEEISDNKNNINVDSRCDPNDKPGENGNPFCADGVTCCPNGTWSCGIGDGTFACQEDLSSSNYYINGGCCDPEMKPGENGNSICSDGVACCPDGTWSCGIGDGSFAC